MPIKKGKLFRPAASEWTFLKLKLQLAGKRDPGQYAHVRIEATGDFRTPKKGEWFLSGAIVEGYYAPNDLSTAYNIGRPVIVEEIEVVTTIL